MDNDHTGSDHPDHSYPYKNEVSLSIGDNNDNNQAAVLQPTPSPRLYSNGDADEKHVPSSNKHHINSKDSEVLMRNGHHASDEPNRVGLDNPGFEEDVKPSRPLSSFGQNGHSDAAKSQNGSASNGSSEKPLAGINPLI